MLTFALLRDSSDLHIYKDLYGENNDLYGENNDFYLNCYIFIGYRNNRYFPHTNPYKYPNRSSHVTIQRSTYKEGKFLKKLWCCVGGSITK